MSWDQTLSNEVKRLELENRHLKSLLFKASEQIYDQPELEQEIQDALD